VAVSGVRVDPSWYPAGIHKKKKIIVGAPIICCFGAEQILNQIGLFLLLAAVLAQRRKKASGKLYWFLRGLWLMDVDRFAARVSSR